MQQSPSLLLKQFLKKEIGVSKRILDIGCGDGVIASYLISSLDCYVDGIDLDKGKVHRANERFKRPSKGFAICSIYGAEDVDKVNCKALFDVIILTHTLHHLTDISKVLSKSKKILKKDGYILIAEYTPTFGESVDNCPRFSAIKIKSILKTARFRNIKKHNLNKGIFIIKAVK